MQMYQVDAFTQELFKGNPAAVLVLDEWLDDALMQNIALENIFVTPDDLNLPFGTIRMRGKGSDGGHNGLKDIQNKVGGQNYARLRFGVGNEFSEGKQVDYVLGEWSENEMATMNERLNLAADAALSFVFQGLINTMNQYNGK